MDQTSPYFNPALGIVPLPTMYDGNSMIKIEPQNAFQGDAPKKVSKPRKRKIKEEKQEKITDHMPVRKKRDRFHGMSEEEVAKRVLPDHLTEDLDIVIVGINPGLMAAYVGHHYAGPGNHFWKCLYLSGLIPEPLTAYDDYKLQKYGIGFTNIVGRTTRGSADLTRKEIKEGGKELTEKLLKYKPKIAVFNGKGIYEVFLGHKNFSIGKQPDLLEGTETMVYVMPSSSARCSQLPRAVDKVPFYAALKKLRDHVRGDLKDLDFSEVCFPDLELKVVKKEVKQELEAAAAESERINAISNVSGLQESFPNVQPNNCNMLVPQGGSTHGNNYMPVKQEVPYNTQDYGGSMNGSGMFYPQPPQSQGVYYKAASFSNSEDNNASVQSGQMVQMIGSFPSQSIQSQMFAAQCSQNNQHSVFMSSRMSFQNCLSNPQGQFLSTQVKCEGQSQFPPSMYPQGQQPSGVMQTFNYPSSTPLSQEVAPITSQGWSNQSCTQSQSQSQSSGFNQTQTPVYIKPEPGEYGANAACPYSNVG